MQDKFTFISIVICFTALASFMNRRFLNLHPTIGALAAGFAISLPFLAISEINPFLFDKVKGIIVNLDFKDLLLEFLLGFMLFAGALHVDVGEMKRRAVPIGVFALAGVVISAFLTAWILNFFSSLLGFGLTFVQCLLFGALISPTDPIAVLAILKRLGAPKDLEMDVCGESLFNDGVGVVLFLTVLKYYTGEAVSALSVFRMFFTEAIGGLAMGFFLGFIGVRILEAVDDIRVHILATLAIASGGFTLANLLGASGAIAMVVAAIIVGNNEVKLSENSRRFIDDFWEIVDEVGNTAIFAIVGFHLMIVGWALHFTPVALVAGLIAIPTVIVSRFASIAFPFLVMRLKYKFPRMALPIMTWGGLRGGLPLAMALALFSKKDYSMFCQILTMTAFVVAFSIMAQGLTMKKLVILSTTRN